ncbi:methylosome subunit pICln isoform X2 [Onthophagus taurus]|uniref:methylosome subunit pICln isoform X2 n=1 Tax=Onthophagus taurus TaxID=166361 RepID=UPI000C203EEA|nr:methylosome subunit pICln-like isoform X2 [Onthophagus taurus]
MVVLSSFLHPDSPIRFEQRNTRAVLDKKDLGLGTLFISERTVSWKEQGDVESGFSLSYHHISLHATSSDPNLYPRECIYIMIDTHVVMPGTQNENMVEDSDSDAESESDFSELILVPGDPSALTPMYEALKECQSLNPDPDDVASDDEVYEDADEDFRENDVVSNDLGDIGGGGDTAMEEINDRIRDVDLVYDNGDQNEEVFEDAD